MIVQIEMFFSKTNIKYKAIVILILTFFFYYYVLSFIFSIHLHIFNIILYE